MKKFLFSIILIFSFSFAFAEKIIFSASSMSGQTGNSNTTTALKGNAYIKTESMEIQADEIELSGEDYRNIKATGNVKGTNIESKMDFTCEELSYDRETKVATLLGNVNLTDTENDVKAYAQMIEYNQETDIAVLQIKINLVQKDNVCTGAYAVYNKEQQTLEISGNAQVKQKEDIFRAQHITLDMDTQDITLGGNVKGTVTDTRETETETETEENNKETSDVEENGENVVEEVAEEVAEEEKVTESEGAEERTDGEVKTLETKASVKEEKQTERGSKKTKKVKK